MSNKSLYKTTMPNYANSKDTKSWVEKTFGLSSREADREAKDVRRKVADMGKISPKNPLLKPVVIPNVNDTKVAEKYCVDVLQMTKAEARATVASVQVKGSKGRSSSRVGSSTRGYSQRRVNDYVEDQYDNRYPPSPGGYDRGYDDDDRYAGSESQYE